MILKRISTKLMPILALIALMVNPIYAENVTVVGTLKQTLKQSSANFSPKKDKVIQLLKVQLSDEEKNILARRVNEAFSANQLTPDAHKSPLNTKKQLGMNNVPVLDQGMHGTCVTFAVSGAIDALLAKGDYISQLCNLQLGSYLEKYGYGPSGWDGSFADAVISQMEQYGIVNKERQMIFGCGGMTLYPINSRHNPDSFIEPDTYHQMSEFIFGNFVNWSEILVSIYEPEKTLYEVKQILNSGDRLTFGVLLPRTDLGTAGAVGKYKTELNQDTWLLTPEILAGVRTVNAAHEMIITGYDDNAVAIDNQGRQHKGLLFLRNSWGSSFGDNGEFYMSYDYFKLLAFDATQFSLASI